ncbi:MAG: hypothetical protein QOE54_2959 [Streptosporangiaceae bacterium]|jgi:hypothetical protein|nr:hypothetical protein [Streptosporangiaceae bacterium]MDX6430593.1 hypothetical protein [Streptosporangiaceae bacterium]
MAVRLRPCGNGQSLSSSVEHVVHDVVQVRTEPPEEHGVASPLEPAARVEHTAYDEAADAPDDGPPCKLKVHVGSDDAPNCVDEPVEQWLKVTSLQPGDVGGVRQPSVYPLA